MTAVKKVPPRNARREARYPARCEVRLVITFHPSVSAKLTHGGKNLIPTGEKPEPMRDGNRREEADSWFRTDGSASSRRRLHAGQSFAHGVLGERGDVVEFEFGHHLGTMRFHRLHAQVQLGGDFFRAMSFGKELQHFALAL